MKIIKIEISSRYAKSFRKLPSFLQEKAIERIKIFQENAFDQRLKTHNLSGKEKECWAFWIDYHYRIKFIFSISYKGTVLFLDVGTHNQVY